MKSSTGIRYWISTTNHKDIGSLYLWFSLLMFFAAGAMALVIRMELSSPGRVLVDPNFYNQMVTLHGLVMIFGAIMPALAVALLAPLYGYFLKIITMQLD